MNETIHGTRSIDATSLRRYIGQYLSPDPRKAGLDPPIVSGSGRAEMGLKHPVLARMLCPVEKLDEYDNDPVEWVICLFNI